MMKVVKAMMMTFLKILKNISVPEVRINLINLFLTLHTMNNSFHSIILCINKFLLAHNNSVSEEYSDRYPTLLKYC